METVQNPTPERESALCGDAWHYTTLTDGPCPTCGDHGPTWAPADPDTLQQIVDVLSAPEVHYRVAIGDPIPCGSELVQQSTANPLQVTCPGCTAALVDEQLGQPDKPERRTIGLEVLTDDLRLGNRTAPELSRYPDARVATVLRQDAGPTVMDTDAEWRTQVGDRPALILARMLNTATGWAHDLHAEPLLPTTDVLTALTGQPPAPRYTEPLETTAGQVRAGWQLVGTVTDADGVEQPSTETVTAVRDCADVDCALNILYRDCVVMDLAGDVREDEQDVHFVAASPLQVRVPAVAR